MLFKLIKLFVFMKILILLQSLVWLTTSSACERGNGPLLDDLYDQVSLDPYIIVPYLQNSGITIKDNYEIIGNILENNLKNKLELLQILADAGAIIDNHAHVCSEENTNAFRALEQTDARVIDFILENIVDFSLPFYANILVKAAQSATIPLDTIKKLKETPGVNFDQTKDSCLIVIASTAAPRIDIISFFLEHNANPTSGLKWYLYNGHEKYCKLYIEHQANTDSIYLNELEKHAPSLKTLITLASHQTPQDERLSNRLYAYAKKVQSRELLEKLMKKARSVRECPREQHTLVGDRL